MDGQVPRPGHDHGTDGRSGFLGAPPETSDAERLQEADLRQQGFVMNLTRTWSHQPVLKTELFQLLERAAEAAGLTYRQRGVLVSACASTAGDSYCSLAWGSRLAAATAPEVAAAVLRGDAGGQGPGGRPGGGRLRPSRRRRRRLSAVTDREEALAAARQDEVTADAAPCTASGAYVTALDRYGDVLDDTAPTVGDVTTAGDDLAELPTLGSPLIRGGGGDGTGDLVLLGG